MHAIAKHVSLLHDFDDLAAFDPFHWLLRDGLMEVRIKLSADRLDARDKPSASRIPCSLRCINSMPPAHASFGRAVLQRSLKIIQNGQHLLDQVTLHGRLLALSIALNALAVVLELGQGPLPSIQVLGSLRLSLLQLGAKRIELSRSRSRSAPSP